MLKRTAHAAEDSLSASGMSPPQGLLWRASTTSILPFNLDRTDDTAIASYPGASSPPLSPRVVRPSSPPSFWDSPTLNATIPPPSSSPRLFMRRGNPPPPTATNSAAPGSSSGELKVKPKSGGESYGVRELPFRLLMAAVQNVDLCAAAVARAFFVAPPEVERFLCLVECEGELSAVADEFTLDSLPSGAVYSRGVPWRAFEVIAPPETIEQPGIASEAAARLAASGVPLAYLSTWHGFLVLVPESQRRRAYAALQPGITIRHGSDAVRATAAAAGYLRNRAGRSLRLTRSAADATIAYVPPERLARVCHGLLRVLLSPPPERAGRVFACCIYRMLAETRPIPGMRPPPKAASAASEGGLSLVLDQYCDRLLSAGDPVAGAPLLERVQRRWRVLQVEDPASDSNMAPLIQPVSRALSDNDVPVFFLCSASADYALVPADMAEKSLRCLQTAFNVTSVLSSAAALQISPASNATGLGISYTPPVSPKLSTFPQKALSPPVAAVSPPPASVSPIPS